MTDKKGFQFKIIPFAVLLILLGIAGVFYLSLERKSSFPPLPTGSYIGKLSGLKLEQVDPVTLYVERIPTGDALLVVVFAEGWKPKVIPLNWKSPGAEEEERDTAGFNPVRLTHESLTLELSGSAKGGSYSGSVHGSDGSKGSWTLNPISPSELRKNALAKDSPFDFVTWLTLKARYRELAEERAHLTSGIAEMEDRENKLLKYISQEGLLRQRAETKRQELEGALRDVEARHKELLNLLKSDVRELEQLNRITRRGRTIELARRVAKRENKWYEVNWEQGVDLSLQEAAIASRMNVNLQKLNQQVARARELELLRAEIAEERARLRRLQDIYQQKLRQNTEGTGPDAPSPNPNERPWWQKWDSLF